MLLNAHLRALPPPPARVPPRVAPPPAAEASARPRRVKVSARFARLSGRVVLGDVGRGFGRKDLLSVYPWRPRRFGLPRALELVTVFDCGRESVSPRHVRSRSGRREGRGTEGSGPEGFWGWFAARSGMRVKPAGITGRDCVHGSFVVSCRSRWRLIVLSSTRACGGRLEP
ncbi:hypothetical protein B0H16DRAFT_1573227, partial [Mycena metata]